MQEQLRHKLALLPDAPGCYLMKNKDDVIIYVGKAKVLKNRVRSYFSGKQFGKTERLVSEIVDFEYIVTASDLEALILECNLIKKYFPKYNVLLKDDKTFPYIKITHERHPRLEVTRRVLKDKGKYFGPYPTAFAAQQTKKLLDRLYPFRKCQKIPNSVCLYYHLGQCLAPCEKKVTPETYEEMAADLVAFFKGGQDEIRKGLVHKMEIASEHLEFERAKELRDLIQSMDTLLKKQKINTLDAADRDIFGFATDKGWMSVQILYIRKGKMIERKASLLPFYGEDTEDFLSFVTQFYSENPVLPDEILLPAVKEESTIKSLQTWLDLKISTPKRGTKKELVDMANLNAKIALDEKFRLLERDEERSVKAAQRLGDVLGIGDLSRIEAFDNSNIQGTNPVSAMVVFIDGKPDKKEYRKYKIKTVQGPDDYATMREVIRRRYERMLRENSTLPDLIIVDGGKGQISSAMEILEDELGLTIPLCGLVKDHKHKTAQLMLGDTFETIDLARDSQEFYLLQRIQEEVHRFAISFHRQQRSKSMIQSALDVIPGVGEKRKARLLKHFGSIQKMKEATIEDFRPLAIGDKLATQILNALKQNKG